MWGGGREASCSRSSVCNVNPAVTWWAVVRRQEKNNFITIFSSRHFKNPYITYCTRGTGLCNILFLLLNGLYILANLLGLQQWKEFWPWSQELLILHWSMHLACCVISIQLLYSVGFRWFIWKVGWLSVVLWWAVLALACLPLLSLILQNLVVLSMTLQLNLKINHHAAKIREELAESFPTQCG